MAKFRKKPVVIEAFCLGVDPMPDWFCDARSAGYITTHNLDGRHRGGPDLAIFNTLEGEMRAECGDWISRGINGGIYPYKPDIFFVNYEPVDA